QRPIGQTTTYRRTGRYSGLGQDLGERPALSRRRRKVEQRGQGGRDVAARDGAQRATALDAATGREEERAVVVVRRSLAVGAAVGGRAGLVLACHLVGQHEAGRRLQQEVARP